MEHPPTPTSTAMVMEHPPTQTAVATVIPTVILTASPTPTPILDQPLRETPTTQPFAPPLPQVQEVATIEDYFASRFFPDTVVVIKDVPLKLFVTRLHREHVNRFTIEPFLTSTDFFPPGTMGVQQFTPDQTGEFKIHNVGHGYQGDFIVVDTVDQATTRAAEGGVQELSLIHDLEGGRVSPARIVVRNGIPVRLYNTVLQGNERVSIERFYSPTGLNIMEGKITTFEFTPDLTGEYTIQYDNHEFTGTLVVE